MERKKENKKKIDNKSFTRRNASFNLVEVFVIVVITTLFVGVSTSLIVYKNIDKPENENIQIHSEELNEFIATYENILDSYVEEIDEDELVEAAIKAIYDKIGDPYTSYLDKETTDSLQEKLNGHYQGIGVEISKDMENGYILISTVFEDSPAEAVGLKKGDYITKINGESVVDKTALDVSNTIKNSATNSSELTYLREGNEYTVTIRTDSLVIPSVSKENFDGIGYLKIDTFSNTTYEQFKAKLEQLERENITGLVIDVRDNTGGYLKSASDIAQLFIDRGKIIYQLQSKGTITDIYKDTTKTSRDIKVVILVNSVSASASEILAAALRDSYGAKLVGKQTYGKGTVQETNTLSNGEMLKYTTAYWLTPAGININKVGLTPDIDVDLNSIEEYSYELDNQLTEAINAVK